MKKTAFISLLAILVILLSSCSGKVYDNAYSESKIFVNSNWDTLSYHIDNGEVNVQVIDPAVENVHKTSYALLKSFDDFDLLGICDLIAKGKILDIREIKYGYDHEIYGSDTSYGSILTIEFDEVFYASSEKPLPDSKTVEVYTEKCESIWHSYIDSDPFKVGEEYYFMMRDSQKSNSFVKYENFCDYILALSHSNDYLLHGYDKVSDKLVTLLQNNCVNENNKQLLVAGMEPSEAFGIAFEEVTK